MMKIEIIKDHEKGLTKGHKREVDLKVGHKLIKLGYAKEISEDSKTTDNPSIKKESKIKGWFEGIFGKEDTPEEKLAKLEKAHKDGGDEVVKLKQDSENKKSESDKKPKDENLFTLATEAKIKLEDEVKKVADLEGAISIAKSEIESK